MAALCSHPVNFLAVFKREKEEDTAERDRQTTELSFCRLEIKLSSHKEQLH